MILDILTVLFFVLGFFLFLWMIGQRRRDVLYGPYVSRRPRRAVHERRRKDVPAVEARGLAALRALVPIQRSWAKPHCRNEGPHMQVMGACGASPQIGRDADRVID